MFNIPASILNKSIAGRYRPVRVTDGPITAHYRFIKNAYCDMACAGKYKHTIKNYHAAVYDKHITTFGLQQGNISTQ